MKCATMEFSYSKEFTALLGCRRSCFAFAETVCQPTERSKSADGGLAKPRGVQLTVAEFYKGALYYGYGNRQR